MSTESCERISQRPEALAEPEGPEVPARQAGPRRPRVLVPALISAALLWLCYFPADCGWLAWVALVPLLGLVRSPARPWRLYLGAWVAGLLFFWPALQWMRVADYRMYATWAGLATYCSFFLPLGIYLLRQLDRRTRLPLVLSVPVVWTALELFRAHFGTGFPWYFLSHTQHRFLPVIQIADLGGAYAVTFLVAAVNALVFEGLFTQTWFRALFGQAAVGPRYGRVGLLCQAAVVLGLLGGTLAYGFWRLGEEPAGPGPRVALIQGNLDQRIKLAAEAGDAEEAAGTVVRHFRDLSDEAARQNPRPELIVWPETSYPADWVEIAPSLPPDRIEARWRHQAAESRELARQVARRWRTNVLLGINCDFLNPDARPVRYNSAVLIRPDSSSGGRYDKIHRVPFGEYVPLRDLLPWMNAFAPYDFDYSIAPGEKLTRFALGPYHFGVLICYEDTDPSLARQYGRTGPGEPAADFLLNLSNDGWFDGTSEHEEHLAICRFRAVESRRAVARAVNMGISAVLDGSGRVVALPQPTWAGSKKVAAVLTAVLPLDSRRSLYARWGDWLPGACWVVLGVALIGTGVRRLRPDLACQAKCKARQRG